MKMSIRKRRKLEIGTHLRRCDRSGFVGHRSNMIKEPYTGLIVLPQFEIKENPLQRPWIPPVERVVKID